MDLDFLSVTRALSTHPATTAKQIQQTSPCRLVR
jgi:hypothetical protein